MRNHGLRPLGVAILLALTIVFPPALRAGVGDGTVVSTTKIQDNGPDTQRFNIVIMGDGFQAAEMATYEARVADFVNEFNTSVNYGACGNAVNFYRVNIASDDSGVDKPAPCYSPAVAKDTYLDTHYCAGGTQRCIWSTNTALVQSTAAAATANWHYVVVLVNDSEHGGCAGSSLTFNHSGPGFEAVVLHELGHALGGLADEYEYGGADTYVGGEPSRPNVTIETVREDIKWFDLIAATTPVPTWNRPDCTDASLQPPAVWEDVIGLYEGAGYHRCGIYRPDRSCLMRTLGADFCAVCQRRVQQVMMVHFSGPNLTITPWGYFQNPKVSPYWQTPDVWVDNNGNSIQEPGEPSIGKADNHLFARVTNSGTAISGPFQVKFSYVPYTGVIDLANSQTITTINRPALAAGGTDVVEVLWPLDNIPPAFAGIDHFCVIVEIIADECASHDNRAQNNFANVPTVGPSPAPLSFYVKNILEVAAVGKLLIEPSPAGWQVTANVADIENIPLQPKEEKLITLEFAYELWDDRKDPSVAVEQSFDVTFLLNGEVLGGVSSNIIARPPRPWGVSLHLGLAYPASSPFENFFDEDVSFTLDLERRLKPRLYLVGLLGYHRFDASDPAFDDTYLWNVSLNLKYQLLSGTVRPYLAGGPGLYIPESGSSEPGVNVGLGLDFVLDPHWTFELGADHHVIFTSGGDTEFTVPHIGFIHYF